jgi:integrase
VPARATGSTRWKDGRWIARLTLAKKRVAVHLATCVTRDDEDKAKTRTELLARLAGQLTAAGRGDVAMPLLDRAAGRDGKALSDVLEAAKRLCAGDAAPVRTLVTFREFADQWTSGALHKRHPDHVKDIKQDDNRERLRKYVLPLVGDVPLREFTIDHADTVMAALPETLSPLTRRHTAQVMSRVLTLAAFPGRVIAANPLPKGYLPQGGSRKALSFLYPDEDRRLLATTSIDLPSRLLYGVLAREGMRRGEAGNLTWGDLDLVRGTVRLDKNKTDDPRMWALDQGVVRALGRYRRLYAANAAESDRVFLDMAGEGLIDDDDSKIVVRFRRHLQEAGVTRGELFERSQTRQPIRVHDLRATFVTLSLANGQTETWVADRTGHRSSVMINRYRRAARQVAELNLGMLRPLDEAIPELRPSPTKPSGPGRDLDVGRDVGRSAADPLHSAFASPGISLSVPGDSRGGTRTLKPLRTADFESAASAIPPLGRVVRSAV